MAQLVKLPPTIVGIDTETTSLDPTAGDIIEFSAIKYSLSPDKGREGARVLSGKEVGNFTRLCRPTQPLSPQVQAITGITPALVEKQPSFVSYREELKNFVGDLPIFAHNASFDINFLSHHGLNLQANPVWDTFILSSIAWPESPSYNLGQLAGLLNLEVVGEHRASADVHLTWQLLNKIYQQLKVSPATYEHIKSLLQETGQEHYLPFFEAAQKRPGTTAGFEKSATHAPKQTTENIDKIFSATGQLAKKIPGFAPRPTQLKIAQTVSSLLNKREIGLIEAGTGSGKTYGYLVPLLLKISELKEKSASKSKLARQPYNIVATYTKNLQDQLITRDLPNILGALSLPLKVASLKGRRNYLCISRLKQAIQRQNITPGDAWLLIKILTWLEQGGSGDLEQLNASHQADHLLRHLHADSPICRSNCREQKKSNNPILPAQTCPYETARRSANSADLIVTNQALLSQLEPLNFVIIDEAHHLEEVIRKSTQVDLSIHRLAEIIAPLKPSNPKASRLSARQKHLRQEIKLLLDDYQVLLAALAEFHTHHTEDNRLTLTEQVRRNSGWLKVSQLSQQLLSRIRFILGLSTPNSKPNTTDRTAQDTMQQIEKFSLELERFFSGSSERIQWLEVSPNKEEIAAKRIKLFDLSRNIQPHLAPIFNESSSVILTSATLTTGGEYGYIKQRLGIINAQESKLGSSIDTKNNMLIYIVDDGPLPNSSQFSSFTADNLKQIAKTTSGRLLSLFTSHQGIRDVYFDILPDMSELKIKVYAQKMTGGRHNIISNFRRNKRAILMGTSSFWEGIDIPGESLSVVLIPRLPFAAPNDPIIKSVADFENLNSFRDLSLPQTILKLRQGIGRLLRSSQDRGAVVILDRRLTDSEYADTILASLPPAAIKIGSHRDLASALTDWFTPAKIANWQDQANSV